MLKAAGGVVVTKMIRWMAAWTPRCGCQSPSSTAQCTYVVVTGSACPCANKAIPWVP